MRSCWVERQQRMGRNKHIRVFPNDSRDCHPGSLCKNGNKIWDQVSRNGEAHSFLGEMVCGM